MAPDHDPIGVLDPRLREAALDVLDDALRWRLTERRWAAVEQMVTRLLSALRARDAEAVRRSTYDLELAGPVRTTPIGDTPVVPAPEPIRVLIDTTFFELGEPVLGTTAEPRRDEAD